MVADACVPGFSHVARGIEVHQYDTVGASSAGRCARGRAKTLPWTWKSPGRGFDFVANQMIEVANRSPRRTTTGRRDGLWPRGIEPHADHALDPPRPTSTKRPRMKSTPTIWKLPNCAPISSVWKRSLRKSTPSPSKPTSCAECNHRGRQSRRRGKGFAVVAGEVKTLSGQTAKATSEIFDVVNSLRARMEKMA